MKFASLNRLLALAAAALVLAGCTKKPIRPDPSVTAMGLTPGGDNVSGAKPSDASFQPVNPDLPAARGPGFGSEGGDRSTLQAQTVYFEFDSSALRPSERAKLKAAKDPLDKHPDQR